MESHEVPINNEKAISNKWITIPIVLVIVLWLANLLGMVCLDFANRGTFGDMFGASNALFSGLAFAGIIYTIALQRKELELQRKELRETKLALEKSAKAQELSERALSKQVESMELSAKLNALTSISNITMEMVKTQNAGHLNVVLRQELNDNLKELKSILDSLK
jgi:hypothetical protein